jgi:aspartate/methionine/tyrosine aminotransferase
MNDIILHVDIGNPDMITDFFTPCSIPFESDSNQDRVGGLSYQLHYSEAEFIVLIKDFYKNILNTVIGDDTYIVLGVGTTNLINAFYYAISSIQKYKQTLHISSFNTIFYPLYKDITKIHSNYVWENIDSNTKLDIIVSCFPNNPDGSFVDTETILQEKYNESFQLFDFVYNSPQFTGIFDLYHKDIFTQKSNISIVSSFSKMGIPGSRCGYLLTKNKEIYDAINFYNDINTNSFCTSGFRICKYFYNRFFKNKHFYTNIHKIILLRKEQLKRLCIKNDITILNKTFMSPYIYTNKSSQWWFTKFQVKTKCGSFFSDSTENSRINLMITN